MTISVLCLIHYPRFIIKQGTGLYLSLMNVMLLFEILRLPNQKKVNTFIFLNRLFESTDSKKYIALAWLTGILPIWKEKTLAFGSFHHFTMLDAGPLTQFIGFTEDEVRELCLRYYQNDKQVKEWYGGYILDGCELFNPKAVFSLMRLRKFKGYWSVTASYEIINDLFSMNIKDLETKMKMIFDGSSVEVDMNMFENYPKSIITCDDALTYLVHLGYLSFDKKTNTVFIPNEDVRISWSAAIL